MSMQKRKLRCEGLSLFIHRNEASRCLVLVSYGLNNSNNADRTFNHNCGNVIQAEGINSEFKLFFSWNLKLVKGKSKTTWLRRHRSQEELLFQTPYHTSDALKTDLAAFSSIFFACSQSSPDCSCSITFFEWFFSYTLVNRAFQRNLALGDKPNVPLR